MKSVRKSKACSLCGKRAVIYLSYSATFLCTKHLVYSVERRTKKTVREYKMLQGAKHVGVALSGGKDSLVMLYLLHKITKPMRVKLSAILVDEGIKGYRDAIIPEAEALCKQLDVPLITTSFKDASGVTMDKVMKSKKKKEASCTYCGVFRRWMLNKAAKEAGVDRIAIGHNVDDMAQSYLMNILRNEQFLMRFNPVGGAIEDDRFVPRIRPLFKIPEKEIALYAMLKGFKSNFVECPYVAEGFRPIVREFINDLESKYPGTKFKILNNYLNMKKEMPVGRDSAPPASCTSCGEPTSSTVCKRCSLLNSLKK